MAFCKAGAIFREDVKEVALKEVAHYKINHHS